MVATVVGHSWCGFKVDLLKTLFSTSVNIARVKQVTVTWKGPLFSNRLVKCRIWFLLCFVCFFFLLLRSILIKTHLCNWSELGILLLWKICLLAAPVSYLHTVCVWLTVKYITRKIFHKNRQALTGTVNILLVLLLLPMQCLKVLSLEL